MECGKLTRDAKPYCTDHVFRMPEVQRILEDLRTVEHERSGGRVDLDGIATRDVLLELELHGERTIERIAKVLCEPVRYIERIAYRLERAGLVVSDTNRRGYTTLAKVGQPCLSC